MKDQILSLGKDTIIYGTGSVITRFVGMLTLPIFTAYLTPEEYGVMAMLILLTLVAQPVFSLGLGAAMGPSYFEGNETTSKSKVVWTAFAINLASACILIFAAWIFPEDLGRLVRLPAEYAPLVSLILTGCALTILVTSLSQRIRFEKRAKLFVYVSAATAFAAILVSVIAVVFLELGVTGMVIGQVAGNAITFLAFLLIGLKETKPSVSADLAKELLRLGLPLTPSFMLLFILMHANKYILEWHAGLDAVGLYSVGFNLGIAISIVTNGFSTAWFPFFMSYMKKQQEAQIIFGRILTYVVFGIGFLCVLFFLGAKPILALLTQESFHGAHVVVGLVATANFAQALFSIFLPGLYFNREVQYVSLMQGLAALLSLPINYYLIINLGILGAGVGLAVGNFLMAVLMYGWNIINKTKYPDIIYEWNRVLYFFVLSLIVISTYLYLPEFKIIGEIFKSLVFGILMITCMAMLLNKRERSFFIVMSRK